MGQIIATMRTNSKLTSKLKDKSQTIQWALLNGNHDFNKVPLTPPGIKVVIHNKPGQRKSWQYHGTEG